MANPASRKFESRMTDIVFTGMGEGKNSAIFVRLPGYSELGPRAAEEYYRKHAMALSHMGFKKIWEISNKGFTHGIYVLDGFIGWDEGKRLVVDKFVEGMSHIMGEKIALEWATHLSDCTTEKIQERPDWLIRAFLPFAAPFVYTGSKNLFSNKEVYNNVMEQAFQKDQLFKTFSDSNIIQSSIFFPDVFSYKASLSLESSDDEGKTLFLKIPWLYKRWGWSLEENFIMTIKDRLELEIETVKTFSPSISRKNSNTAIPDPYGMRSLYTIMYRVSGNVDNRKAKLVYRIMSSLFPVHDNAPLRTNAQDEVVSEANSMLTEIKRTFLVPEEDPRKKSIQVEDKVQPVAKGVYIQCHLEHKDKTKEILEQAAAEIPGVQFVNWRVGTYCGGYIRHSDNVKGCGLENRIRLARSIFTRLQTGWEGTSCPFIFKEPEMNIEISMQYEHNKPIGLRVKIPNSLGRELKKEIRERKTGEEVLSAPARAALEMEKFFASRVEPMGEWVPAQSEKQIYSKTYRFPLTSKEDLSRAQDDIRECISSVEEKTGIRISVVRTDYREKIQNEFERRVIIPNVRYFAKNFRNIAVQPEDIPASEDIPEPDPEFWVDPSEGAATVEEIDLLDIER